MTDVHIVLGFSMHSSQRLHEVLVPASMQASRTVTWHDKNHDGDVPIMWEANVGYTTKAETVSLPTATSSGHGMRSGLETQFASSVNNVRVREWDWMWCACAGECCRNTCNDQTNTIVGLGLCSPSSVLDL